MRIIIVTGVALAALGTTLYQIKTGIDERQADLQRLQASITETQRDIAILEAELAFLSRPERLMTLSSSLLNMKPISQDRILPLDAIPMRRQQNSEPLSKGPCVKC